MEFKPRWRFVEYGLNKEFDPLLDLDKEGIYSFWVTIVGSYQALLEVLSST